MKNLVKKCITTAVIIVAVITGYNIWQQEKDASIAPVTIKPAATSSNIDPAQEVIKNITPYEIKKVVVSADPPGKKAELTPEETREFTELLNNIILYEKVGCYTENSGQWIEFKIVKTDGSKMELVAFNPFFVIDGSGYMTEYKACEELSNFANMVLCQRG